MTSFTFVWSPIYQTLGQKDPSFGCGKGNWSLEDQGLDSFFRLHNTLDFLWLLDLHGPLLCLSLYLFHIRICFLYFDFSEQVERIDMEDREPNWDSWDKDHLD